MKYKKLLLQIAGLIITVAIVLSCSKQEQTGPDVSMPGITPSAADVSIANKIKAFKGKMEYLRNNPHYKSGETMSVDSAVWYIEAASNYTYGDAATPYGEMVIDSFDVSVPVSNGEIQLNDILIAYDEMIGGLSEKYNAIPDENKHLIMNDVSFKSEDEGTATLGITAGFGIEGEGNTSWIFNHEWYYGEQAGDCDFNNSGTDAAEKIEDKILARKGTPPPGTYYLEEQTFTIYANSYLNYEDLIPEDNMYDYLMFHCWDDEANVWPNVHTCVSVDEMNFYLLGTEYVLYHDQPQFARPPGKSLITVNLIGDALYPNGGTLYMHWGIVSYGIPYLNEEPPENL